MTRWPARYVLVEGDHVRVDGEDPGLVVRMPDGLWYPATPAGRVIGEQGYRTKQGAANDLAARWRAQVEKMRKEM